MDGQAEGRLELPQLTACFSRPSVGRVLLVGGGRPPTGEWLRQAASGREIWCADRGVAVCRRAGIAPDWLLGDQDSAPPEDWRWGEEAGARTLEFPADKDYTDTQLALQKIKATHPAAFVLLTGALGGRFDHLFSTLYSLAGSGLSGCLADESEAVFLLRGPESVTLRFATRPLALSLLPLTPVAEGVTLTGVHWPLRDASLSQREPCAVSNRVEDDGCRLSLGSGQLALTLCWREKGL